MIVRSPSRGGGGGVSGEGRDFSSFFPQPRFISSSFALRGARNIKGNIQFRSARPKTISCLSLCLAPSLA